MSKTSSVGSLESAVTDPLQPSTCRMQQQQQQHQQHQQIDTESDYPTAIELLRQRSQRLATRLQQTQKEFATKLPNTSDYPLIEQKANQFMRNYVSHSQLQLPQQRSMPMLNSAATTAAATANQLQQRQHQQHQQNHLPPMPLPMSGYPYPMGSYGMPVHIFASAAATATTTTTAAAMPSTHQQQQQQQQQEQKRRRKSRQVLNGEVDALKELVLRLACLSPDIKAHAQHFITHNEVLAQLDWLNLSDGQQLNRASNYMAANLIRQSGAPIGRRIDGGMDMNRQQQMQQQLQLQQQQMQQRSTARLPPNQVHPMNQMRFGEVLRSRRDSELSTTSSSSTAATAQQQQYQQQQQQQLDNSGAQSPRKRNRNRKKRSDRTTPRSLQTELEAMRSYINKIVQQYVGSEQQLPQELLFKGDFGDLETHARRLVAAGYGRIVEEEIRVNRKNNRQAFITMSTDRETLERDGIVLLPVARRYAFEGDTVRAFVLNVGAAVSRTTDPSAGAIIGGKGSLSLAEDEELSDETESQDSDDDSVTVIASDNCPKAFVIAIVKQTELRQIVGNISFTNPTKLCDDELFYKFRPFDLRMPMAYIPQASCAAHLGGKQLDEVCGLLYVAHILETDSNGHCIAELVQPLGRVGDLDSELKAILFHNSLRDIVPYEERFNEMYAEAAPAVTADDLVNRRDMRKSCVFTIDPLTARDLDDAISIEKISENEYEVGVHISDVSHYLQENSELDNIVKQRSTSIYLANEVIHMLPKTLCFRCSLLPGEDKYSFSVFWRMDGQGKQLGKPAFTRSVINSCSQFAYEHAQKIIDNPREPFTEDDFPNILNGFTVNDIVQRVTWLHGIASNMRTKRFDNGALTINNAKVRFTLDPLEGEPIGFEIEQLREANHMIEEFMLLANQAVAKFIHDAFPKIAVLRNHPPPLTKSLKTLRDKLYAHGLELDYSSSKALQASMRKICQEAADPVAMSACLSQLLMKPMARATYICSDGKTEPSDLWHYALSIPIYTHFTSPIRRYPDVMVHRLLAAGLNYCTAPERTPAELNELTKIANERKYNAKQAGDDSSNLFFKRYVSNRQVIYMRAVVMEIFQHMMNVVTLESGHVIGINYKMQRVLIDTHNAPNFILVAERNLKQPPYKLQFLSVVPIRLIIWDGKLTGFLLTHDQRQKGPNMEHPSSRKDKKQQQQQQLQQQQQARNNNKLNKTSNSPIESVTAHSLGNIANSLRRIA
ncbi:uncharacterized protein Dmoj_GI12678 [Drosophila mojavensis]|uniref:RNB domain-containing protein n=1 Tax=Drosophila mojavensis TaxID=7230 RepID=B4KW68_DROMO|nr:uncharacterized protein Dmoj_GI12678 [Drosophila mojavensis]